MRGPKSEILEPAFRADTREELVAFLARERVDPYRDGRWGKVYRQGGPLEWFNEPMGFEEERAFVEIDIEAAVANFLKRIAVQMNLVPHVGFDVPGAEVTVPMLDEHCP